MKTGVSHVLLAVVLCALGILSNAAFAIPTLGPRAYLNAPVGLQVQGVIVGRINGDLSFDRAGPIATGINLKATTYSLLGEEFMDWGGHMGALVGTLTFGQLTANLTGTSLSASETGLMDSTVHAIYNISGAPAMTLQEWATSPHPEDDIFSGSLGISVPVGEYKDHRLLNPGTNRWVFKPELAWSRPRGKMVYEVYANTQFFTDNHRALGGGTLSQDPLYGVEAHISRSFGKMPGSFFDAAVFYANGGQQQMNGVDSGPSQDTWSVGGTLSWALNERWHARLVYSQSVSTPEGVPDITQLQAWLTTTVF